MCHFCNLSSHCPHLLANPLWLWSNQYVHTMFPYIQTLPKYALNASIDVYMPKRCLFGVGKTIFIHCTEKYSGLPYSKHVDTATQHIHHGFVFILFSSGSQWTMYGIQMYVLPASTLQMQYDQSYSTMYCDHASSIFNENNISIVFNILVAGCNLKSYYFFIYSCLYLLIFFIK